MTDNIYVGNAGVNAPADRGWLLGHFKPPGDPHHSTDVEIKWGTHAPGERRAQWVDGEQRSMVMMLISGRFRIELPGRDVLLSKQGDYVLLHGVNHSWEAEEETILLTVRWPSVPGYAVPAEPASPGPGTP
ncbi:MAG: signal peptidase I [Gemmatimonadota bacterium]